MPSSMCFDEAWRAREEKKISEEEFYHHVLAHLTGVSHEDDESKEVLRELPKDDPLAHTVLHCAKNMGRIEDATPFEQVFSAYSRKDLEGIKSRVASVKNEQKPYVLQLLAMQALVDRRPDVLKFCLDRGGFEYEQTFIDRADSLSQSIHPKTFEVLETSNFRKLHPLTPHPAFMTDVGGQFPVNW